MSVSLDLPDDQARWSERLPSWLDDHFELLSFLRDHDIAIGMDRQMIFLRLLLELGRLNVDLENPRTAARWLGPGLCSTPAQQELLPDLLEAYASRSRPSDEIARTPGESIGPPMRTIATTARFRWRGLAVTIATLIAFSLISFGLVRYFHQNIEAIEQIIIRPPPTPGTPSLDVASQVTSRHLQWHVLAIAIGFAMPLLAAALLLTWRRGRDVALSRSLARDGAETYFDLSSIGGRFQPFGDVRKSIRALGDFRRLPTHRFHAAATIRATIRAGGRIQLRHGQRLAVPDYVFITERTSMFDHVGHLGDLIARRLEEGGLNFARYEFDQDIRAVQRPGTMQFERFEEIAARHIGHRLIVLSDGAPFSRNDSMAAGGVETQRAHWSRQSSRGKNPGREDLRSIVDCFAASALLTPSPELTWGPRETSLTELGFQIFPISPDGLRSMAAAFQRSDQDSDPSPGRNLPGDYDDLVGRLEQEHAVWLSDRPPVPAEQLALVNGLRAWLGAEGFLLVASLALFPDIRSEITLALVDVLSSNLDAPLVDELTLAEIARLPWLRHGRMPDWVRIALLRELPPASRARARTAYATILDKVTLRPGPHNLRITRGDTFLDRLRAALPWNWHKTVHERITWNFLRGYELELAVPRALGRRLRPRLDQFEMVLLAAALVCGIGVVIASNGIEYVPEIALRAEQPASPPQPVAPNPPVPPVAEKPPAANDASSPNAPLNPPAQQPAANENPAIPTPAPPMPTADVARTYLVFFDFRKADLTQRAKAIIKEAADNATRVQYTRIEVNGFDDTSGTAQFALGISERRARAVAAELVRNGVPQNAIVIRAYGSSSLLVPTGPGVREPQNRRTEIIIR